LQRTAQIAGPRKETLYGGQEVLPSTMPVGKFSEKIFGNSIPMKM